MGLWVYEIYLNINLSRLTQILLDLIYKMNSNIFICEQS